jgi:hypothetical protein
MVGLALHFDCAQRLGSSPDALFSEVGQHIADPHVSDLLRRFGSRDDIALESFGWMLVDTPSGPDFEPV